MEVALKASCSLLDAKGGFKHTTGVMFSTSASEQFKGLQITVKCIDWEQLKTLQ